MTHRVISLLVVAALAAAPAAGRASDGLAPLRTLAFDVEITISVVRRAPRSGSSTVPISLTRRGSNVTLRRSRSAGDDAVSAAVETRGTISVEVVAATADGGLVADIAEVAPGRTREKVRVAVPFDGTVSFDPKYAGSVSEEEIDVARWLARGFYSDHPREMGASWTNDQSSNGLVTSEHYRVTAAADNRVTLSYGLEMKSESVEAFASNRQGTLVYDTGLMVPVRATYDAQSRQQHFEAQDEAHTSVKLTLKADSFTKKT